MLLLLPMPLMGQTSASFNAFSEDGQTVLGTLPVSLKPGAIYTLEWK